MHSEKSAKKVQKKASHKHSVSESTFTMKSFRMYEDVKPFTTFKLTRQTAYWTIFLVFLALIQLLVLKAQLDIIILSAPLYP